jgi:predicted nucleic acid-binding protein
MNRIFVDALYWVAVVNPRDQWHVRAVEVGTSVQARGLVTTELVLIELMNFFGEYGASFRLKTARLVQTLLDREDLEVVEQTHANFLTGIELYRARPDKGYSLTDCISMNVMRERGLTEVLTHDHNFTQEGFIVLL